MSRVTERAAFDQPTRLTLAESDLDANDEEKEAVWKAMRGGDKATNDRIDATRTVLIGILGSIATASVLLAINIIVQSQ